MAAKSGKKVAIGSLATREARIGKAAKRAGRLGMLKEGKARLFIAGVLPVALYEAEHEPWKEREVLTIEKQAVKALQIRSPGVPHAVAMLTSPAVADPRFRVHFAAVERWSREVWATAYGNASQVHGFRSVHKDSLNHREVMAVWHRIHITLTEVLIKEGGPMGALSNPQNTLGWNGRQQPPGYTRA